MSTEHAAPAPGRAVRMWWGDDGRLRWATGPAGPRPADHPASPHMVEAVLLEDVEAPGVPRGRLVWQVSAWADDVHAAERAVLAVARALSASDNPQMPAGTDGLAR